MIHHKIDVDDEKRRKNLHHEWASHAQKAQGMVISSYQFSELYGSSVQVQKSIMKVVVRNPNFFFIEKKKLFSFLTAWFFRPYCYLPLLFLVITHTKDVSFSSRPTGCSV